jgi:hypothetical protein
LRYFHGRHLLLLCFQISREKCAPKELKEFLVNLDSELLRNSGTWPGQKLCITSRFSLFYSKTSRVRYLTHFAAVPHDPHPTSAEVASSFSMLVSKIHISLRSSIAPL